MVQVDAALLEPLRLAVLVAVLPPLVMMAEYPVVESCPLASPSTKFPLETKLVSPHPDKSFSQRLLRPSSCCQPWGPRCRLVV